MRDSGPICVKNSARRSRLHALALQRMGQIQQSQERRRRRGPRQQKAEASRLGADAQRPARRARRRQHRRQRPRLAAHHRRMLAEHHTGTQSRLHPRRLRAKSSATISVPHRSSGCATASPATTLTATSTISHASSTRPRSSPIVEKDQSDANYAALQENLALLRSMKDLDGRTVPHRDAPDARAHLFRRTAPARQLREFLHREQFVIVPTFNDRQRSRRPQHARRAFSRPRDRGHRLPRSGPGPRHAPLHDAAAAEVARFAASAPAVAAPRRFVAGISRSWHSALATLQCRI